MRLVSAVKAYITAIEYPSSSNKRQQFRKMVNIIIQMTDFGKINYQVGLTNSESICEHMKAENCELRASIAELKASSGSSKGGLFTLTNQRFTEEELLNNGWEV